MRQPDIASPEQYDNVVILEKSHSLQKMSFVSLAGIEQRSY